MRRKDRKPKNDDPVHLEDGQDLTDEEPLYTMKDVLAVVGAATLGQVKDSRVGRRPGRALRKEEFIKLYEELRTEWRKERDRQGKNMPRREMAWRMDISESTLYRYMRDYLWQKEDSPAFEISN